VALRPIVQVQEHSDESMPAVVIFHDEGPAGGHPRFPVRSGPGCFVLVAGSERTGSIKKGAEAKLLQAVKLVGTYWPDVHDKRIAKTVEGCEFVSVAPNVICDKGFRVSVATWLSQRPFQGFPRPVTQVIAETNPLMSGPFWPWARPDRRLTWRGAQPLSAAAHQRKWLRYRTASSAFVTTPPQAPLMISSSTSSRSAVCSPP
jgi:hypothetical protein